MIDIVERLRRLAERERPYGSLPDTLDEAAVEIERLRAALEEIADSDYASYGIRRAARAALDGQPAPGKEVK